MVKPNNSFNADSAPIVTKLEAPSKPDSKPTSTIELLSAALAASAITLKTLRSREDTLSIAQTLWANGDYGEIWP